MLVGGYECEVIAATASSITCITSSVDVSTRDQVVANLVSVNLAGHPSFTNQLDLNSTRDFGSPGWWIRMWSLSNYNSNQMREDNMQLSIGYRGDSLFSMYYLFGSKWETMLGVGAQTFGAQFMTYLVAPVTGDYRFVMSSDDNSFLYCRLQGAQKETTLFNNLLYTEPNLVYSIFPQRLSQKVFLQAGQRLRLRAVLVNTMTIDYLSIGLRIDPSEPLANIQSVAIGHGSDQTVNLTNPVFLQHHLLREIQVVSLSITYQREIQVC